MNIDSNRDFLFSFMRTRVSRILVITGNWISFIYNLCLKISIVLLLSLHMCNHVTKGIFVLHMLERF